MTVAQARAAIRRARRVFVGVQFFDGGDPQYVRTSKAEVLEIVCRDAEVVAGRADVRCLERDGDVYLN